MNLPAVIKTLIQEQNNLDPVAYANCFSETATVFDEGQTHTGKAEIQQWIKAANKKYNTQMTPLAYTTSGTSTVLTAEVSGTFDGSPAVLKYHFELNDGLIQSLKVTG